MARLPTYQDLGEAPSPRPQVAIARVETGPLDVQLGESRAVRSLGANLTATGADLFEAQDRFDTLRAEDAYNNLQARRVDLTVGENGFQTKRSGDAMREPLMKDYGRRFDDAVKEIGSGLGNDSQREKFARRAQISNVGFQQDILKHVYAESIVYGKQVLEGTVKTEVRNAQVSWDDPFVIQSSRDRIDMAISEQAKQHGWLKEETEAVRQSAYTEIATSVISSAVANGDVGYAEDYYKAHKKDLSLQTQQGLLKQIQDGEQKNLMNAYQGEFLSARDDTKRLDLLEKRVAADKVLSEDRKNILLGRIMGRTETLERRAEADRIRTEKTIQKGIDQVNALTLQGYEPTIEQMQPLVDMAKGTELEGSAQNMVATANLTRAFRTSLPVQQEAFLAKLESDVRRDPTKFEVNVVNRFRTIYENQQKDIREDPQTFAARQGLVPELPAVDLVNPANTPGAIGARAAIARGMVSTYQAPMRILTKEEKDLLLGVIRQTPVVGRREYFGSLARATGGDMEAYSAMMAQIAPDDPVTAIAGIYAGRGLKDDKGNQVADLLLRGQAILHPNRKEDGTPDKGKTWPMPQGVDEQTMKRLFADYERDAYAGHPEARNAHFQAAWAIYAAKSSQEGDASGVINSDRWRESVKLATGGIERYNSRNVVMPWGLSYGQFKDGVRARAETLEANGQLAEGVTSRRLRDLPLENIGDGRYVFRSGDAVLLGKNGQPLVLDFTKPIPGGKSATQEEIATIMGGAPTAGTAP